MTDLFKSEITKGKPIGECLNAFRNAFNTTLTDISQQPGLEGLLRGGAASHRFPGNSGFRAGVVVFSYIFSAVSGYLKLLKSQKIPAYTSHTIVFRVLCFWLIPAVILSAIAGKFSSEYTS